jgi:putative peptide zinc metalloprotease protein
MSASRALFSESWHRVATQRIRLRPSVRIRKQFFRGERWHVVHDPFTNNFYRFAPEAHDFVSRLDGTHTVEEIWSGCLERGGERAPGQGEVVAMLAQLYQANLIVSDVPADTARLFERQKKQKQREFRSQLFNVFFLRLRLWDPDPFLRRTLPVVGKLLSPVGALAWVAVVATGLAMALGDWTRLLDQSQGVLDPNNLLPLYAAFAVTKLVHEFGHAYATRRFGGEVHAMGITLLVFTPVPYVDATAAWAFRERRKRVLVGLAGMIPELFLAGLAAIVWAGSGAGMVSGLAYNVMFVASVSTLIFNANPLLRFDGYYILADLTDTPNLQQRATQQCRHLAETHLFGGRLSTSPARSPREGWLLAFFGVASWAYRIFITWTLILFVADKYFGLGLIAAAVAFVGTFVVPVIGAVRYLAAEPRIERVRRRAVTVSAAAVAAVVLLLAAVPAPNRFRAPGVLRAQNYTKVIAETGGYVAQVTPPSRTPVAAGDTLLRLVNPELDFQIAAAEAEQEQTRALERQMLRESPAGIEPLRRRLEAVDKNVARLHAQRAALDFRARQAGLWISPRADGYPGMWVSRGAAVGELVDEGAFEFYAVVPQGEADNLFRNGGRDITRTELRLHGEAEKNVAIAGWRVVPGRQDTLPSAALGWAGGGPVRVALDDASGVRAAEPFFLVVARVAPGAQAALLHDRTGVIRFSLPWEPLLWQWARSFRQLLQERYQL